MIHVALVCALLAFADPRPVSPQGEPPATALDAATLQTLVLSMRDTIASLKDRVTRLESESAKLKTELADVKKTTAAEIAALRAELAATRAKAADAAERSGTLKLPPLQNGRTVVLWKNIEATGERYENKPVRIVNCAISGTSDIYVSDLPGIELSSNGLISYVNAAEYEKWLGVNLTDSAGGYTSKVFIEKSKWVDLVLSLDRKAKVNIDGVVVSLKGPGNYGIIVTQIEVVGAGK
jgi:hypothetical protein